VLAPKLFTALPAAIRSHMADDYIAFALGRDGEPDVQRRTLSRREAFFGELAQQPTPVWDGAPVAQADFTRWHVGERPLTDAPPLIVWLSCASPARKRERAGASTTCSIAEGSTGSAGLDSRYKRPG